jgi:hypothetical protein
MLLSPGEPRFAVLVASAWKARNRSPALLKKKIFINGIVLPLWYADALL